MGRVGGGRAREAEVTFVGLVAIVINTAKITESIDMVAALVRWEGSLRGRHRRRYVVVLSFSQTYAYTGGPGSLGLPPRKLPRYM